VIKEIWLWVLKSSKWQSEDLPEWRLHSTLVNRAQTGTSHRKEDSVFSNLTPWNWVPLTLAAKSSKTTVIEDTRSEYQWLKLRQMSSPPRPKGETWAAAKLPHPTPRTAQEAGLSQMLPSRDGKSPGRSSVPQTLDLPGPVKSRKNSPHSNISREHEDSSQWSFNILKEKERTGNVVQRKSTYVDAWGPGFNL
jgi:hypothetical protein